MRFHSSRQLILALLLAPLACGGDDAPAPPAGPEPVATVQVSPDQLDLEKGESEQLNVTLLDAGGAALTGRSITYNSNATGVATVNNDGLVTAVGKGEAQITVSSEGVSDDALVTVSLADFAPASDMSLSGLQEFATLSIPEGVKVSATDDLELLVEGLAEIAGALESDCKAIKVSSEDFTLIGTIDTGCSDETAAGAPLTIDANGFVELVGAITYGGKVDISNDPTLTDADFEIPMAAAASSLAGQAAFGAVVNVDATPSPATAPDGADGRDWVLSFRGDVEIGPLSNIRGQNGGDGVPMGATGSDGGDAGRIRVRVTGNLRVGGTITAGKGGDGAEGEDVAAAGQNANATGGAGGVSGTVLITSGGGAGCGRGDRRSQPRRKRWRRERHWRRRREPRPSGRSGIGARRRWRTHTGLTVSRHLSDGNVCRGAR